MRGCPRIAKPQKGFSPGTGVADLAFSLIFRLYISAVQSKLIAAGLATSFKVSADPLFSVDWAEGPLGPPIPPDKNGVTPPQWPSAGRDFSPETAGHQPRALRPLASASRGGVLAAVRHAGERERAARRAGANRTGAVG